MEKFSKELVAASAVPIILSLLNERESYGYQMIKSVSRISDDQLIWKEGTLYPLLDRMESRGFISSRWEQADNGRKRKYYRIEARGKEELAREMEQWKLIFSTIVKAWELPDVEQ